MLGGGGLLGLLVARGVAGVLVVGLVLCFLFAGLVSQADDPAGDAGDEAEEGGGDVEPRGLGRDVAIRAEEPEDDGGDEEEVAGDEDGLREG